jgi:hypothetical protein
LGGVMRVVDDVLALARIGFQIEQLARPLVGAPIFHVLRTDTAHVLVFEVQLVMPGGRFAAQEARVAGPDIGAVPALDPAA